VLRLKDCDLGEGGGRALAERDTARQHHAASLDLRGNCLGDGEGRALEEPLRLNTTLTSLNLCGNYMKEGGGRALEELGHLASHCR